MQRPHQEDCHLQRQASCKALVDIHVYMYTSMLEVPKQALREIPLGFGVVVEDTFVYTFVLYYCTMYTVDANFFFMWA